MMLELLTGPTIEVECVDATLDGCSEELYGVYEIAELILDDDELCATTLVLIGA